MEEPMVAMNHIISTMEGRLRTEIGSGHLTLLNKVKAIGVGLMVQPLTLTSGQRTELQIDCPLEDLSLVEEAAATMDRAAKGLIEADRRFGKDIPDWAIAIHPLMRMGVRRSGHGIYLLGSSHREQKNVPDRHEEIIVAHRPGLHLEIRLLRMGMVLRARHTYATVEVPRLPEVIRMRLVGKRMGDLFSTEEPDLDEAVIQEAIDRTDAGVTRVGFQAPLVPLAPPPEGEDPWWIDAWSKWLSLKWNSISSKVR